MIDRIRTDIGAGMDTRAGRHGAGQQQHQRRQPNAMPTLDWLAQQAGQTRTTGGDYVELSVAGLWDLAQQRLDQLPLDLNPQAWQAEMEKLNSVFAALHKLEAADVERVRPNTGEGLLEAVTRVAASLPEPQISPASALPSFAPFSGVGVKHQVGLDTARRQFWRDLGVALNALGEKLEGTNLLDGPPIEDKPLTYEHLVRPKPKAKPQAESAAQPTGLYGDMTTQMRQMMATKAYGEVASYGRRSDLAAPKTPAGTPEQLGGTPALSDEDRLYWEKCKRRLFEGLYCVQLLRDKGVTDLTPAKGESLLGAIKTALKAHGINGVDYDPEGHKPATPGYKAGP